MLTMAFGESTMRRTQVQLWYNRFKEGREDVNNDARSTTDESIEAVKKMILDNRRITIREVAYDVGISYGLCQANFTDVLGTKLAAKIVSKLSHGHPSGDADDVQRRSRFAYNGHNC